MANKERTVRLNSLLKAVISDVIRKEVKNPDISPLFTVTRVDISKDLRHAKVYVSVIGDQKEKNKTLKALSSAAGFIGMTSAKQVVLRFFPKLQFILDDAVDQHMRVEGLLKEINTEREVRDEKEF